VVEVTVRDHEPLERALKRFKKKWERAGVLREVRRNAYYIKPSDDKRATRKKAIRRMARLARIQAMHD
jgi:small subunit ribosomal protein S21